MSLVTYDILCLLLILDVQDIPCGIASVIEMLQSTPSAVSNDEIVKFIKGIIQMYWLDAGHSGEGGVWITDKEALSSLSLLTIEVHVATSPLQVNCISRPWIGEEEKRFVSILREMRVKVIEKMYFENEPGSLENHFKILNEF